MKKIINLTSISYKGILSSTIMAAMLVSFVGIQSAHAALTRSLDFGATGSEVSELQAYLATNASIYPEGLVTGYFGGLTQAATQRFQTAQGIVSNGTPSTTGYGRVGPQTMTRINALMGGQDNAPVLSAVYVQYGNTSATLTWVTNEPTQGQLYYDTAPLRFDEATGPHQQPYVSGVLALSGSGLQTNHTVVLQNLQPNTTYYYLTRGVDSTGNISITWPKSFHTNN